MDFVPPRKVFQQAPQTARARHEIGTYEIPGFLYPTRTKTGGMASVFQGHPYPRKGFIYAEAVMAVAKVKRVTLSLFQPFADLKKGLLGFVESYLYNYNRLADGMFAECDRVPYLQYQYYCEFSKSVWNFTFLFLRKLGISFNVAYKTGLILATVFENDDAYRFPAEDVLSESSQDKLLANPRTEVLRLVEIYKKRSNHLVPNGQGAGDRIVKIAKLVSFLLFIPKIRKAFTFALQNVNFEWFQYDEIDYYWTLCRGDYQSLGKDFEERKQEQLDLMVQFARMMNPDKEIKLEPQQDGSVNIQAYDKEKATA